MSNIKHRLHDEILCHIQTREELIYLKLTNNFLNNEIKRLQEIEELAINYVNEYKNDVFTEKFILLKDKLNEDLS